MQAEGKGGKASIDAFSHSSFLERIKVSSAGWKKNSEDESQENAEKLMSWSGQVEECEIAEKWRTILPFGSCMTFIPFEWIQDIPSVVAWADGRALGTTLRKKKGRLYCGELPTMGFEGHFIYTWCGNWEGVGANIQDTIESLPRTSYQDHELSPRPPPILLLPVWNKWHIRKKLRLHS